MATVCSKVVRGKRARITLLNECGEAVTGPASTLVTSGFITVTYTPEVEAGDEFVQKNADGDLCINDRSPDVLKRFTTEIEFCEVDPDLVSILLGATLETDFGGDNVGFRIAEGAILWHAGEVWFWAGSAYERVSERRLKEAEQTRSMEGGHSVEQLTASMA